MKYASSPAWPESLNATARAPCLTLSGWGTAAAPVRVTRGRGKPSGKTVDGGGCVTPLPSTGWTTSCTAVGNAAPPASELPSQRAQGKR